MIVFGTDSMEKGWVKVPKRAQRVGTDQGGLPGGGTMCAEEGNEAPGPRICEDP